MQHPVNKPQLESINLTNDVLSQSPYTRVCVSSTSCFEIVQKQRHHLSGEEGEQTCPKFSNTNSPNSTRLKFGCSHLRTAKEAAFIFEYLLSALRDQNPYQQAKRVVYTQYIQQPPFENFLWDELFVISLYLGHHRLHISRRREYRKLSHSLPFHLRTTYLPKIHTCAPAPSLLASITQLPLITPIREQGRGSKKTFWPEIGRNSRWESECDPYTARQTGKENTHNHRMGYTTHNNMYRYLCTHTDTCIKTRVIREENWQTLKGMLQ